jgi:hypothetical protein
MPVTSGLPGDVKKQGCEAGASQQYVPRQEPGNELQLTINNSKLKIIFLVCLAPMLQPGSRCGGKLPLPIHYIFMNRVKKYPVHEGSAY